MLQRDDCAGVQCEEGEQLKAIKPVDQLTNEEACEIIRSAGIEGTTKWVGDRVVTTYARVSIVIQDGEYVVYSKISEIARFRRG